MAKILVINKFLSLFFLKKFDKLIFKNFKIYILIASKEFIHIHIQVLNLYNRVYQQKNSKKNAD